MFISCINIDVSPQPGRLFPLTKCVPWAAYIQKEDGSSRPLEQPDIIDLPIQQSTENPGQVDLEVAIQQTIDAREIGMTV